MGVETGENDIKKTGSDRRAHRRVRGPFDAVRLGLLEFDLTIHDLSVGGCLISSRIEIRTAHPIRLLIALPDGNSVMVRGLIAIPFRDVGFAVRFIDLDEPTRETIEQGLAFVQLERSQN